jgi:hypothetical protein
MLCSIDMKVTQWQEMGKNEVIEMVGAKTQQDALIEQQLYTIAAPEPPPLAVASDVDIKNTSGGDDECAVHRPPHTQAISQCS